MQNDGRITEESNTPSRQGFELVLARLSSYFLLKDTDRAKHLPPLALPTLPSPRLDQ